MSETPKDPDYYPMAYNLREAAKEKERKEKNERLEAIARGLGAAISTKQLIDNAADLIEQKGGKEDEKIIFISCGQYSQEEKKLGEKIYELIKGKTQYQPYYADKQTSLKGLTDNIFNQLNKCIGIVAILHNRDLVGAPTENTYRGSVWIEQEIAIASFIEQILGRHIEVFLYIETGLKLEGVRKYIHLNSTMDFTKSDEVIFDLEDKISKGIFNLNQYPKEKDNLSPLRLSAEQIKEPQTKLDLLEELLHTAKQCAEKLLENPRDGEYFKLYESLSSGLKIMLGNEHSEYGWFTRISHQGYENHLTSRKMYPALPSFQNYEVLKGLIETILTCIKHLQNRKPPFTDVDFRDFPVKDAKRYIGVLSALG